MQRTISHIANGVLIYAIFYGIAWVLAVKGGLVAQVAFGSTDGVPDSVNTVLVPFLASGLAALIAQAGLRLTLKRLRLRLSTSEQSATYVFMGVLTVLSFTGGLTRVFETPDSTLMTQVAIVLGAWLGVAIRRRIPI